MLAGGAASAGLAAASYMVGSQDYTQYKSATTASAATSAHTQVQTWATVFTVGAIGGGVLLAASPIIWLLYVRPAAEKERNAIEQFDEQIRQLQQQHK
jgi:hypothetical protein